MCSNYLFNYLQITVSVIMYSFYIDPALIQGWISCTILKLYNVLLTRLSQPLSSLLLLLSSWRKYYPRAKWLCSHGSSCVSVFVLGYHCRLLIEDSRVQVVLLCLCFLDIGYHRLFQHSLSWVCFTRVLLLHGLFSQARKTLMVFQSH